MSTPKLLFRILRSPLRTTWKWKYSRAPCVVLIPSASCDNLRLRLPREAALYLTLTEMCCHRPNERAILLMQVFTKVALRETRPGRGGSGLRS